MWRQRTHQENYVVISSRITTMADSRYTCSFCSKSFAQKRHRNRHMLNHEKAKYPCQYCTKSFHRKDVQKNIWKFVSKIQTSWKIACTGTITSTYRLYKRSKWVNSSRFTAINLRIIPYILFLCSHQYWTDVNNIDQRLNDTNGAADRKKEPNLTVDEKIEPVNSRADANLETLTRCSTLLKTLTDFLHWYNDLDVTSFVEAVSQ